MAQPTVATRVLDAAATALEGLVERLVERLRARAGAGRPAGDGLGTMAPTAEGDGQAPPEHWLALARRGAPQLLRGSATHVGRDAGPVYQTGPGAGTQRSAPSLAPAPAPGMPTLHTRADVRESARPERPDPLPVPPADEVPIASAVVTEPVISDPQAAVGPDGPAERPLTPHLNWRGETAVNHLVRPDVRLPPPSGPLGSLPRPVASHVRDRHAPRRRIAPAPAEPVLSAPGAGPNAHEVDACIGPACRPDADPPQAPADMGPVATAARADDDTVLRTVWPCLPGEGDPGDDPPAPWPSLPGEAGAVGHGGAMPGETRRRSGSGGWSV